jgi:hypothetical protein
VSRVRSVISSDALPGEEEARMRLLFDFVNENAGMQEARVHLA